MKQMKKSLAFLLAVIFSLSLTACGSDDGDDAAGSDWRTTGVVVDRGTITHDGDSVNVLVTVDPDSAAFYWDQEEQVLFDSVSFPVSIPDAEAAFGGLLFDDLNGDGESDVTVDFYHEDESETHMVWIWDPEERYVYQEDLSYIAQSGEIVDSTDEYILDYVGLWEYTGENIWLRISDDATWEFVNSEEDVIESGDVLLADAEGIELYYDGSGDVLRLDLSVSGDLLDSANGGSLHPVDSIQPTVASFESNGLFINCDVDGGTYLLENGVCSYSGLGDGYNTDDVYWEVTKRSDYAHDGIREIEFDAICYIPDSSIPYFTQEYITNINSELYDYYSGMWLTAATAYSNTERGENHYIHTIEWNGQNYDIEFFYATDWQDNVGDWAKVFTKSYIVYLPEDYDGLIFAAEKQQDNYKDTAKVMQLDSICPEANIMDIDLLDPYSSLYFAICY